MNLKEFSQMLGLSATTVSRALGGYPEVSDRTRRLVQEAALRHGYRPDRRAASLATGRAMAIGHVIPTSMGHEMVNPVFADFVSGAGEVYSAAGYDMKISFVPDGDEIGAYRQMIADHSVDGVIVHGPREDDARLPFLLEAGIPFVVHGRFPHTTAAYTSVDVANTRAFRRATDLLLDLGHTRIALVNGPPRMDFALRRRAGWEEAHAAYGHEPDPVLVRAGEMSEQNGHAFAADLLKQARPTAFLVASLIMALGVRRAVYDAGLSVGRDISIVTHDDVLGYISNGDDIPIFTATRSSVRAAGYRCAELLLSRIAKPDTPAQQELWDCELVVGGSTGPATRTRTLSSGRR